MMHHMEKKFLEFELCSFKHMNICLGETKCYLCKDNGTLKAVHGLHIKRENSEKENSHKENYSFLLLCNVN